MIENKEELLLAMEDAVNTAKNTFPVSDENEKAYGNIGTAVHWIVDCIDRIPFGRVLEEHKPLFGAIRCVNNCLKHNRTFIRAHKSKGADFPFDFATDLGPYYVWGSLDNVKVSKKYEKNFREGKKCYNEFMRGKGVTRTLVELKEIVKIYYRDL